MFNRHKKMGLLDFGAKIFGLFADIEKTRVKSARPAVRADAEKTEGWEFGRATGRRPAGSFKTAKSDGSYSSHGSPGFPKCP